MRHPLVGALFVLFVLTAAFAARALGRFLTARREGIAVEGLIIGAGRPRRQWRTRAIPCVELRTFPFLVRLALAGMSPGAAPEPGTFAGAPTRARFLVVLAGLAAIYALSCGASFVALQAGGVSRPTTAVTVARGGEAERAGMRDGDRIVEVQGKAVSRWEDVRHALQTSEGSALDLAVERGGERVPLRLNPVPSSPGGWTIGTRPLVVQEPASLRDSLLAAVMTPWRLAFGERAPVSVEVVPAAHEAPLASRLWTALAMAGGQLSGWLLLLLLPLPGLDGARLSAIALEGLTGRRLGPTAWSRIESTRLLLVAAAIVWLAATALAAMRAVAP